MKRIFYSLNSPYVSERVLFGILFQDEFKMIIFENLKNEKNFLKFNNVSKLFLFNLQIKFQLFYTKFIHIILKKINLKNQNKKIIKNSFKKLIFIKRV